MFGTCGTCEAFRKNPGDIRGNGKCVLNPPVPILVMLQVPPTPANPGGGIQPQIEGVNPPVAKESGCYQHRPKLAS
jgi:hypothetical protein